jgi:hypothetical protein
LSKEERCRAFNFKAAFKAPAPAHGNARPGDAPRVFSYYYKQNGSSFW